MGIISFIEGKIGSYLILILAVLLVVGGIALKIMASDISSLHQQVGTLITQQTALRAANDALADDVADVKKIQDSTNIALSNARDQAALDVQTLRNTGLPTEAQINRFWVDAFKRLNETSHAP